MTTTIMTTTTTTSRLPRSSSSSSSSCCWWFVTTTTLLFFVCPWTVVPVSGIHECGSLFIHDVFRCSQERRFCLATKDLVCREPLLSPGIYDQCPDQSNQWRGLCNRICHSGFRMRRGFKCGDGSCITDFMKWCDGKVDCPNDNTDEAHCNCTARPSDCSHWASGDNRRGLVSSQYLFRRVFAPMGFFIIILVIWKYYRTMKLRQRLASLHHDHPDVRLCDPDVVYVGGVTELARSRNHHRPVPDEWGNSHRAAGERGDPFNPIFPRVGSGGGGGGNGGGGRGGVGGGASGTTTTAAAATSEDGGGVGGVGMGPPPYSSTIVGPPPYQGLVGVGEANGRSTTSAALPGEPPSYQESVDPRHRLPSGGADDSSGLRVALPPLTPIPPLQNNNNNNHDDANLPPPPPYESVAKKQDE